MAFHSAILLLLDVGLPHLLSSFIYPFFLLFLSFLFSKINHHHFLKISLFIFLISFPSKDTFEKSSLMTSNHFLLVLYKNDSGVTPGTLKGWYIIEGNSSNCSLMLWCCSQLLLNLQPWGYEWQPIKVLRKLKIEENRSKSTFTYLTNMY